MPLLFKKGFTLIELLIVVAIIAILAAIAVPNFLEAQTRSKVSRAKADMRSDITALESYRVDNNTYPQDGDDPETMVSFDSRERLRVLTTPIAYLTALPFDPFNSLKPIAPDNAQDWPAIALQALCPGDPPYPYLYNTYGQFKEGYTAMGIWQPADAGHPDNFSLTGLGPDRKFDSVLGTMLQYDPTNGTVSAGDIVMSGGNRTALSKP